MGLSVHVPQSTDGPWRCLDVRRAFHVVWHCHKYFNHINPTLTVQVTGNNVTQRDRSAFKTRRVASEYANSFCRIPSGTSYWTWIITEKPSIIVNILSYTYFNATDNVWTSISTWRSTNPYRSPSCSYPANPYCKKCPWTYWQYW